MPIETLNLTAPLEKTETLTPEADSNLDSNTTEGIFGEKNRERFKKMTEAGKEIAHKAYEGLNKIPGVKRLTGKLQIGYDQFWVNQHQTKAGKLKGKMDVLDAKCKALEDSKVQIAIVMRDLNIPNSGELQLKIAKMDQSRDELLNKRDRIQSKFEARDSKAAEHREKRDVVANKLIEHYDEKLKPMEGKLEALQEDRKRFDLLVTVTETRHTKRLTELAGVEKKIQEIEKSLKRAGMSEKEIKSHIAITSLRPELEKGRVIIQKEKKTLAEKKAVITAKIARANEKANPYRDRRSEFERVKNGVHVDFNVTPRNRNNGNRESQPLEQGIEGVDIVTAITTWNEFISNLTNNNQNEIIEKDDFLEEIKQAGFSETDRVDKESFKKILEKYYILKGLAVDTVEQNIDAFFSQIV